MGVRGGVGLVPAAGVGGGVGVQQCVEWGARPPLARPLEIGVRLGSATGAWAALRAPRAGDDGERALGVEIAIEPAAVWAEWRDAPPRGAAGVTVEMRPCAIAARVDLHPLLGD